MRLFECNEHHLLLAGRCFHVFELHNELLTNGCLEKCHSQHQNGKNICSNLYELTHITVRYYKLD